ncbi:outer membrane beta-barrel protein [Sulfurovum sp. zt1-1]|uniref:Outer membrane beta-barrel protein n=1 Tax=Sulfurovum zhangzhouensis TaxID=3019067 RepID=A0ABT7QXC1_9BACT|nr:outer membrane beta-barrel protein [Sulfurovum zhangzhouensis]MDM5271396.1 outer membrane beta-barrel protein [Sulfurovum zhangzhouensis]
MKNLTCSIAAAIALSSFAVAGGNIEPVAAPMEEVAPAPDDSGFYIGGAIHWGSVDADYTGDGYWDYYDGYYGGPNYWDGGYWDESGDWGEDGMGWMLQAGYQFNKYFAVEGRYWKSSGDLDWDNSGSGYDSNEGPYSWNESGSYDGNYKAYGIYLKAMYPIYDKVTIYGLAGWAKVDWDDGWIDENGISGGIGLSYAFTDNISVFVDYVILHQGSRDGYDYYQSHYDDGNYYEDYYSSSYYQNDYTVDTINLGITYKF